MMSIDISGGHACRDIYGGHACVDIYGCMDISGCMDACMSVGVLDMHGCMGACMSVGVLMHGCMHVYVCIDMLKQSEIMRTRSRFYWTDLRPKRDIYIYIYYICDRFYCLARFA